MAGRDAESAENLCDLSAGPMSPCSPGTLSGQSSSVSGSAAMNGIASIASKRIRNGRLFTGDLRVLAEGMKPIRWVSTKYPRRLARIQPMRCWLFVLRADLSK